MRRSVTSAIAVPIEEDEPLIKSFAFAEQSTQPPLPLHSAPLHLGIRRPKHYSVDFPARPGSNDENDNMARVDSMGTASMPFHSFSGDTVSRGSTAPEDAPSPMSDLTRQGNSGQVMLHKLKNTVSATTKEMFYNQVHAANFAGQSLKESSCEEAEVAVILQHGFKRLFKDSNTMLPDSFGHRHVSFDHDGVPCMVQEYCSRASSSVRSAFGVAEEQYASTLGGSGGDDDTDMRFISTQNAQGKSISWFLLSADMEYFIKTCSQAEADLLRELLPSYLTHVNKHGLDSLLPRYHGVYRVMWKNTWQCFLVMSNVFAGQHPILKRFDLKGSTHSRWASAKELAKGKRATLQDRDLLQLGRPFVLDSSHDGNEGCARFLRMVEADCEWLKKEKLIDYSLLVGLADTGRKERKAKYEMRALHLVPTLEGADLAYIGIIDILTRWSAIKIAENAINLGFWRDISCQPPDEYSRRCSRFASHIFAMEDSKDWSDFEQRWLLQRSTSARRGSGNACFAGCFM